MGRVLARPFKFVREDFYIASPSLGFDKLILIKISAFISIDLSWHRSISLGQYFTGIAPRFIQKMIFDGTMPICSAKAFLFPNLLIKSSTVFNVELLRYKYCMTTVIAPLWVFYCSTSIDQQSCLLQFASPRSVS